MRRLLFIIGILSICTVALANFGSNEFGQQNFGSGKFGNSEFSDVSGDGSPSSINIRVTPSGDTRVTPSGDIRIIP